MASGRVFINDLDDFIAPSQACVNPLVSQKLVSNSESQASVNKGNSRKHGRVTLEIDYSEVDMDDAVNSEMNLIKPKQNDAKKVATVSLNDCLACSGCVTSAETVLIQEQSIEKFYTILEEKDDQIIVVQISPNSIASLAEFLSMSYIDMFLHVAGILKSLGVHYVLDSSSGADVALIETKEELIHRLRAGAKREWPKTAPISSVAQSSTTVMVYDSPTDGSMVSYKEEKLPPLFNQLPLLSAHCPGWVCYAEKTAPQALPFLSTAKSAQQIVGSLVKSILLTSSQEKQLEHEQATAMDISESLVSSLENLSISELSLDERRPSTGSQLHATKRVTVVSVQPCFDKKLEASRKDFYHSTSEVNEVDIVISTGELWQIVDSACWKWSQRSGRATTNDRVAMQIHFNEEDETDGNPTKKKSRPATERSHDDFSTEMTVDVSSTSSSAERENQTALSPSHRLSVIKENFAHVFEYMHHEPPDALFGNHYIERIFRSFSVDGLRLLAASERNMASGGYAEYIFRAVMRSLYDIDLSHVPLVYKQGRNVDMQEIDTEATLQQLGQPVVTLPIPRFSVAKAYGFRNIQTVLNRMKRQGCEYDFIEVMACPSGCNNGGGQLKSLTSILPHSSAVVPSVTSRAESPAESKHRISSLEKVFHEKLLVQQPEDSLLAQYVYDKKRLGKPLSDTALQLLHTRYHAVPKLETVAPLAVKW